MEEEVVDGAEDLAEGTGSMNVTVSSASSQDSSVLRSRSKGRNSELRRRASLVKLVMISGRTFNDSGYIDGPDRPADLYVYGVFARVTTLNQYISYDGSYFYFKISLISMIVK